MQMTRADFAGHPETQFSVNVDPGQSDRPEVLQV
jgi:hypothetical protein